MKDKDLAVSYISNFRRHFSHFLLPGFSLRSTVMLVKEGGGIVRLEFTNKGSEDEVLSTAKKMPEALQYFGIRDFGTGEGIVFSGTNMIMSGSSMLFIKGEDKSVWSDGGAKEDVKRIIEEARKHQS